VELKLKMGIMHKKQGPPSLHLQAGALADAGLGNGLTEEIMEDFHS